MGVTLTVPDTLRVSVINDVVVVVVVVDVDVVDVAFVEEVVGGFGT
jgi:hypothetical protein